MSKEVDNLIPFPHLAEPVVVPNFIVEEEEDEETEMTIDFDNMKVYTTEESWVLRDGETKEVIAQSENLSPERAKVKSVLDGFIDVMGAKTFMTAHNTFVPESIEPPVTYTAPETDELAEPPVTPEVPGESFKNELQDIFMNTLASKAVASLLKKHRDLDDAIDYAISVSGNMGEMTGMIEDGIDVVMEQRRKELRACYNGSTVRYENIPDWAKSYVRDFVREKVTEVALLDRF